MVSAAQTNPPPGGGGDNANDGGSGGDGHLDAHPLIELFGGIRPMAAKLGVPVSTVQGWRERNAIPTHRLAAIKDAAAKNDIAILPEHVVLQMGPPTPPDPAPGGAPRAGGGRTDPGRKKPAEAGKARGNSLLAPGLAGAAVVIAVIALLATLLDGGTGPVGGANTGEAARVPDEVAARVDDLAADGESIAARVGVLETLAEDTAALNEQVTALRQRVDGDVVAQVATLQSQLDELAAAALSLDGAEDDAGEITARVDELTAGLHEMQNSLDELAAVPAGASGEVAALTTRVDALAAALAAAQESPGASDDGVAAGLVAGLAGRVERLEDSIGAASVGDEAITAQVFTTLRLRQQLTDGGPLDAVLAHAAQAFADDGELAGLVAAVDDAVGSGPVATRAALARDFDGMAPGLARAVARGTAAVAEDADWLARAQARLAQVVTVERAEVDGSQTVASDAVASDSVADAGVLVAAGDLAGAAAVIDGLADGTGAAAAWVTRAEHRVAVETAMDALEAMMLGRLAADLQAADRPAGD